MNYRELRIGNLLHTQITHKQKEVIQPLVVHVDEIKMLKAALTYMSGPHLTMTTTHLFYSQLSGISLTPRLLLKCGFEKLDNESDEMAIHYDAAYVRPTKTIYPFYIVEESGVYYLGENYDSSAQKFNETPIRYLHQLQNLFYALSGEELNINL